MSNAENTKTNYWNIHKHASFYRTEFIISRNLKNCIK